MSAHMLDMTSTPATLRDALTLLAGNCNAFSAHVFFGSELLRLLRDTDDATLDRDAAALAAKWTANDGVPLRLRHISRHLASDVQRAIRDTRHAGPRPGAG